jgi:hypothetical protein
LASATKKTNMSSNKSASITTNTNQLTLTRDEMLKLMLVNPEFKAFLAQLRTAEGYAGPDKLTYIDDHRGVVYSCDDILMVLRLDADGTPSKPRDPARTVQDGQTHLPMWIFAGHCNQYCVARSKNPLYVGKDGKIHSSTMATGVTLRFTGEHESFADVVMDQKEVFLIDCLSDLPKLTKEKYEAHIWMSIVELHAMHLSM